MQPTTHRPRGRRPKTEEGPDTLAADERYRAPALDKGLDILELLATHQNCCQLIHLYFSLRSVVGQEINGIFQLRFRSSHLNISSNTWSF